MTVEVEDRNSLIRRESLTDGHVWHHTVEGELILVRLLVVKIWVEP
jgi:hypothetical protein